MLVCNVVAICYNGCMTSEHEFAGYEEANNMTIQLTTGKVTANRGVLNGMSIAFHEAANLYRLQGCYALEKDARENGDRIYEALEKTGYYKDV